jgi:hypothetical protein
VSSNPEGTWLCARMPSPFRVLPPVCGRSRSLLGPRITELKCFFNKPRTFFHILPPLVECRCLSSNRAKISRFSQSFALSFSHSEDNRSITRPILVSRVARS